MKRFEIITRRYVFADEHVLNRYIHGNNGDELEGIKEWALSNVDFSDMENGFTDIKIYGNFKGSPLKIDWSE